MTQRIPLLAMTIVLLLSACGAHPASAPAAGSATSPAASAPQPTTAWADLNVFAAASLTEAFTEIGERFEADRPGVAVAFNFAGSQQLAQQIAQGAPADVFASANRAQMEVAIESGDVISGTQRTFVRNRLVVVTPKDNPADLLTLQDLARPGVKLVLAAAAVPVGRYSLDFLAAAAKLPEYTEAYSPTVLKNVVSYEENVRSVLSKVALGEADAGIVYTSDIGGARAADVGQIDIPDNLNTIATYPIAVVKDSRNAALAQAFVDFVLADEGQKILAKHGFIPAGG